MSNKLRAFDFHSDIEAAANQAAPLFNLYGWVYAKENGSSSVPNHNQLVRVITEQVEYAIENLNNSKGKHREAITGSGRFRVRLNEYEGEVDIIISLELAERTIRRN